LHSLKTFIIQRKLEISQQNQGQNRTSFRGSKATERKFKKAGEFIFELKNQNKKWRLEILSSPAILNCFLNLKTQNFAVK
jgi:hypothetical protein